MKEAEIITRVTVPALDHILGQKLTVLNDGFVRVMDYMGSDESIVQAARVSYGKGTKSVSDDRGLINYLMRHRHTTPFEMCELKLHVRVPMDCWRQWIRHRTASVNEYSTRYSEAIDSAQKTPPDKWRLQSGMNKQGSGGYLPVESGELLTKQEDALLDTARMVYENRLKYGVAREQARKDLTLSTYTEAYWKIDLHNLFHFLSLRLDAHAQEEIRAYADIIAGVVDTWCPLAYKAFKTYHLGAIALSENEKMMLRAIIRAKDESEEREDVLKIAKTLGWLDENGNATKNRERDEFDAKLLDLDLEAPWMGGKP